LLLPHAGGHRNRNVAALATEKKYCVLFFLPRFAGTIAKEATYAVTGGNWELGRMILGREIYFLSICSGLDRIE
jgi:hypothetical protein